MGDKATYKQTVETKITTFRHTIRIPLNSNKKSIEDALKRVPDKATVSMVLDDITLGDYGEIVFTEER